MSSVDPLITIILTEEQRNALIALTGEVFVRTDKRGREVRITIENWKDQRVYVNFYVGGKRIEYTYLSLADSSDVKIQFEGDALWLLLEAIINGKIDVDQKAAEIEAEIINDDGGAFVRVAFPGVENEVVEAAMRGMKKGDIIIPSNPMPRVIAYGTDAQGRVTMTIPRDYIDEMLRKVARAAS